MTLEDNNAVQLWRKAETDSRDVVFLFNVSPDGDDRAHVFAILAKLRAATAAMQALERLMIHGPPKVG